MAESILPNHRTSNATKRKPDWYESAYEYYISVAESNNNKTDISTMLDAANGIVDEATYDYVMTPLSGELNKVKNLPGVIRNVDFVTPIKEKNIGEYIELPYRFHVLVNDPDVIMARDFDIQSKITRILEQEVINTLNANGVQTGIESQEIPNIEEQVNEITSNWLDERATDGQNMLKLINHQNNFDVERIQNFFYWWATEQFYIYHHIENGEVIRETITPEEGYPIINGELFVDDYDGFMIKRQISFEQFLTKYRHRLSNKDKEIVEELVRNRDIGRGNEMEVSATFITDLNKRTWTGTSRTTNSRSSMNFTTNQLITERVLFFKTLVKKNIVTYTSPIGDMLERIVDEEYELNPQQGDLYVKEEWIHETWTGGIIGAWDGVKVYVKPEPVEVQIYDSQFACKLPISGKVGLLNGNDINPISKRLLPYLALYRIYTLQQERAIAKYKGSLIAIPKSMMYSNTDDATGAYFYMKADGTIIYDDTKITPNEVAAGFKVINDDGLERFIGALSELRRQVKEEAWELANMNDPRSGNISGNAGKGVTEQSIYRAKLGSALMIYMFNKAMERSHLIDLELSKVAYIDGKSGYYDDENGEPIFVNIDGIKHFKTPYDLYILNAKIEDEKLKRYQELAFSAGQNGDFDLAAKAIDANNSITLKRSIDKYMEEKRAFEESMKQKEAENAMALQEKIEEGKVLEHDRKLEEIIVKEKLVTERELMKLSMPEGEDGSNFDSAVANIEERIKERKLELDTRKQDHKENQDRINTNLKERQIRSAEHIAKINKN